LLLLLLFQWGETISLKLWLPVDSLSIPKMIHKMSMAKQWNTDVKTKEVKEKAATEPLCPPQTPLAGMVANQCLHNDHTYFPAYKYLFPLLPKSPFLSDFSSK
jgi:hypothetical protein